MDIEDVHVFGGMAGLNQDNENTTVFASSSSGSAAQLIDNRCINHTYTQKRESIMFLSPLPAQQSVILIRVPM